MRQTKIFEFMEREERLKLIGYCPLVGKITYKSNPGEPCPEIGHDHSLEQIPEVR